MSAKAKLFLLLIAVVLVFSSIACNLGGDLGNELINGLTGFIGNGEYSNAESKYAFCLSSGGTPETCQQ